MLSLSPVSQIYLFAGPVDFRKGIDSLAGLCKAELGKEPYCGAIFGFCNRTRTTVKLLTYDGQGFWLCQKRLSRGKFEFWPQKGQSECKLEATELQILLANGNPSGAKLQPLWKKIA